MKCGIENIFETIANQIHDIEMDVRWKFNNTSSPTNFKNHPIINIPSNDMSFKV